jgi:hypothetical protein
MLIFDFSMSRGAGNISETALERKNKKKAGPQMDRGLTFFKKSR